MNARAGHIVFLIAVALMAGTPSNAEPWQPGTHDGVVKSAGVKTATYLPRRRPTQTQSSYIDIYHCRDVAPFAKEKSAAAENDMGAGDLGRAMSPLIAWIVAKTNWKLSGAPAVRFVSQAQIDKMFAAGRPRHLVAHSLYCEDDHTIYLPDGWNSDRLLDRSKLLHELVHHLQYLNHVPAVCPLAYERQAYNLQAAWLRDQGVKEPLDLMGVSQKTIYLLSHCPEF